MDHVDFNKFVTLSAPRLPEGRVERTQKVISNVPITIGSERFQVLTHEANNQQPITNTHINIGTGKEVSIKELAETIKNSIGFKGDLYFNTKMPDGTLRKLTDSSKLHQLGWDLLLNWKREYKRCINGI